MSERQIDPARVVVKQVLRSIDDSDAIAIKFHPDGATDLYLAVAGETRGVVRALAQLMRVLVESPSFPDALLDRTPEPGATFPPVTRHLVAHATSPLTCCTPCDSIVLHFPSDDEAHLYPTTRDRRRLAARLAKLVLALAVDPDEILRVTGANDA